MSWADKKRFSHSAMQKTISRSNKSSPQMQFAIVNPIEMSKSLKTFACLDDRSTYIRGYRDAKIALVAYKWVKTTIRTTLGRKRMFRVFSFALLDR